MPGPTVLTRDSKVNEVILLIHTFQKNLEINHSEQ